MGIVFTATDLASGVIGNISQSFFSLDDTVDSVSKNIAGKMGIASNRLGTELKTLGKGLGLAAVGISALAGSFSLARSAGEFELKLQAVGAVVRATNEEMKLLESTAINAGLATQFSPTEAVEGLTSLATAGLDARQATSTLVPVLDLAAGSLGQLGVAGAADAVVGTLASYKLAASEAADVTDRLLKITQLTNFQAADFQVGLSKAAAAGGEFNQSLNDVLITVGLMRNANIDASSASTAFREAVRRLATDQRVQNKLLQHGVEIADAQTGKIRPLIEVMFDLQKATSEMTQAQRKMIIGQIFGARGILAYSAIVNAQANAMRNGNKVVLEGADAVSELRNQLGQSKGTAAEFRTALLSTFEGQKTFLEGTLQTFGIAIGQPFVKVLKPIVEGVVFVLGKALELFQAIPKSVKVFGASLIVMASFAATITGLIIAVKSSIVLMGLLGFTVGGLAVVFGKILLVVGAVSAAVYLLKTAWVSNFAGIRDAVIPIATKVQTVLGGLFALLTKGEISGKLAQELTKAENKGLLTFLKSVVRFSTRFKAVMFGIGDTARNIFNDMSDQFKPVVSAMTEVVTELFNVAMTTFNEIATILGFEQSKVKGLDNIRSLSQAISAFARGPMKVIVWTFAEWVKGMAKAVTVLLKVVNLLIKLAKYVPMISTLGTVVSGIQKTTGFFTNGEGPATTPANPLISANTPEESSPFGNDGSRLRAFANETGRRSTLRSRAPVIRERIVTQSTTTGQSNDASLNSDAIRDLGTQLKRAIQDRPVVVSGSVNMNDREFIKLWLSNQNESRANHGHSSRPFIDD